MLIQHVRYSLRLLRQNPGFSALAVMTFGLAIGATTAVFSQVRATLLAPLPFPDPNRLVSVWPSGGALARSAVSPHMYDAIRELPDVFTAVAAIASESQNLTGGSSTHDPSNAPSVSRSVGPQAEEQPRRATLGGEPERVSVARATQSAQAVLGLPVALGRWFLPEEDVPTRNAVTVLSRGLWMRRFGGDPAIVGSTLLLNGVPHLVVGVIGADGPYPARADLWVPIGFTPEQRALANRGSEYLDVVARTRPGVSMNRVRIALDDLGQRLRSLYGISVKWTLRSATLDDDLRGNVKPIAWAIFGAVVLVFVIACANVANLLLARAGDRQREFAVRLAVGAAPGDVKSQALVEAATLAVIGGAVGLLLAAWLSPILAQIGSRAGLQLVPAHVEGLVLLFGFGVTLASALLAGALPAWHASRVSLNELLARGGRGSSGSGMRPVLVAAEVALAFVVVVSAALLLRSLSRVTAVDPGYRTDHRLTASLTLPRARYATRPQRQVFQSRLLEDLGAIPGVDRAAAVSELPLSTMRNMASFDVEHRVVPPGEDGPHADMRSASPSYFPAMSIGLSRGRLFEDRDRAEGTPVAIIDDEVARRVFGAEDPIGKRVALGIDPDNYWREIVGIVGSVRHDSLESTTRGTVYVPLAQRPTMSIFAVLKTSGDPVALVSSVREVVKRLDPDLPLYDVSTLDDRLSTSVGRRRITVAVVGLFAALALLLALTGIYGAIAYAVIQRTREVGVRMALGAQRGDVLWLFVRGSLRTSLAGVAAGVLLAVPLTSAGAGLLFQVRPHDAATYATSAAAFVTVAVIVSAVTARRAAAIEPMQAIRQ